MTHADIAFSPDGHLLALANGNGQVPPSGRDPPRPAPPRSRPSRSATTTPGPGVLAARQPAQPGGAARCWCTGWTTRAARGSDGQPLRTRGAGPVPSRVRAPAGLAASCPAHRPLLWLGWSCWRGLRAHRLDAARRTTSTPVGRSPRCSSRRWRAAGAASCAATSSRRLYRGHFGDLTLARLRTPTYAPIWNVERNRLELRRPAYPSGHAGGARDPDGRLAPAVRPAGRARRAVLVRRRDRRHLPGATRARHRARRQRRHHGRQLYPHEFGGEDITGWNDRPLSIVSAASQVRTCQQAELAREHLARLRQQARTLLVGPVPYGKVAGTGFYEQVLDARESARVHARRTRGDAHLPASTSCRSPTNFYRSCLACAARA